MQIILNEGNTRLISIDNAYYVYIGMLVYDTLTGYEYLVWLCNTTYAATVIWMRFRNRSLIPYFDCDCDCKFEYVRVRIGRYFRCEKS